MARTPNRERQRRLRDRRRRGQSFAKVRLDRIEMKKLVALGYLLSRIRAGREGGRARLRGGGVLVGQAGGVLGPNKRRSLALDRRHPGAIAGRSPSRGCLALCDPDALVDHAHLEQLVGQNHPTSSQLFDVARSLPSGRRVKTTVVSSVKAITARRGSISALSVLRGGTRPKRGSKPEWYHP